MEDEKYNVQREREQEGKRETGVKVSLIIGKRKQDRSLMGENDVAATN